MLTNTQPAVFQPTEKKSRINSLDVIRGIALLGILLMNINGMGLPFAYSDPTVAGGADGLNLQVWIVNNMLFEGTMRGLFTLLFGAGIILLTSRLEKRGAGIATADIYYRRILWLLVFGLINAWLLLWDGDILYPYAIFALMLFPFRHTSVKKLLIAGCVLVGLGIAWDVADYQGYITLQKEGQEVLDTKNKGAEITEEQEEKLTNWEKFENKKTPKEVATEIENMHQGYFAVLMDKAPAVQFMQTRFVYRLWPWDILSFMLIGMAFFKMHIFHGERSSKYYARMLLVGYAVGLSINYMETRMILSDNFAALTLSKADQTYQIGRLFTTIGHVGLFMLFIKSGMLRWLQKSLAAVGTMALTHYLMHSVITSVLFYGFGFSLFGRLQRYELYYIVFSIWIFQLIISPIWLRYFQYGPVEWVWRSLTYQKMQPFKLVKEKPAIAVLV